MRRRKAKAIAAVRDARSPIVVAISSLIVLLALSLGGCNTIAGMGEDVSAAGQAVDTTAERTQDRLGDEPDQEERGYQAGRY